MSQTQPEPSPVVKVARDLTQIVDLVASLEDQAIARDRAQTDGTSLPGGLAMVALAPVANLEAWAHRVDTLERLGLPSDLADDDDWEPPLQTLLFWSEAWRTEHDSELDGRRPTIRGEANFIRWMLDWAWRNEVHFEDFARDIRKARTNIESLLAAGDRSERGIPCMYEECRGKRLVRKLVPCRDADGEKSWRLTDWHCPGCKRQWDQDRYAAMVTAASERTKFEDIAGQMWCSVEYAARKVERSVATVRSWVQRGEISAACIIAGKRKPFVPLDDVRARAARARRRGDHVA